jgi:hypothetical protein
LHLVEGMEAEGGIRASKLSLYDGEGEGVKGGGESGGGRGEGALNTALIRRVPRSCCRCRPLSCVWIDFSFPPCLDSWYVPSTM